MKGGALVFLIEISWFQDQSLIEIKVMIRELESTFNKATSWTGIRISLGLDGDEFIKFIIKTMFIEIFVYGIRGVQCF